MRKSLTLMRVACAALALALAAQAAAARQGEITIEGRLARTTEAGGWLIVSEAGKYLILNARTFQSKPWFREGASVEATGEAKQDVMTSFQEGVPFQVRTMIQSKGRGGSQTGDAGGAVNRRAAGNRARRRTAVRRAAVRLLRRASGAA